MGYILPTFLRGVGQELQTLMDCPLLKRLTLKSHFQTDLTIILLSSSWPKFYSSFSLLSSFFLYSLPSYRILFEATFFFGEKLFFHSFFQTERRDKKKVFEHGTYFTDLFLSASLSYSRFYIFVFSQNFKTFRF